MKMDRDGKLGMSCARVALEEKGSEGGTLWAGGQWFWGSELMHWPPATSRTQHDKKESHKRLKLYGCSYTANQSKEAAYDSALTALITDL
jgi:hypothetical protein